MKAWAKGVMPGLFLVFSGEAGTASAAGFCSGRELVTVAVIGDCLPCRRLETTIGKGVDPFSRLSPVLSAADVAIANLEGPLTSGGRAVGGKRFTFRCPPARAEMLERAGIDAVSLANNHIMDYGASGLADTIRALSRRRLKWAGAGNTLDQAREPASLKAGAARIAFLAYNRTYPKSFWATGARPGTTLGEESYVREDVARAARSHDLVIVMLHGGREKSHRPRIYQRELAKTAIEAGADLFVGAHPHVAQGVERIGDAAAVYSLGDGVFGGSWTRDEDSLLLRALFRSGHLAGIELFALNPSVAGTGGSPALREGDDADAVLDRVAALSRELGTFLERARSVEGLPCLQLSLGKAATPYVEEGAERKQGEQEEGVGIAPGGGSGPAERGQ